MKRFLAILLVFVMLSAYGCTKLPDVPDPTAAPTGAPTEEPDAEKPTAAPSAAPDETEEPYPGGKVYTCTYLWGEEAEEEYTWTIILIEPESGISETDEATGFIWEGWTYVMKDPGPYFETACASLPLSGRMWRNETEDIWFFGGEDGPENESGPCILWQGEDRFSFAASPAVSYWLVFSLKD